jgi:hypothetical protein
MKQLFYRTFLMGCLSLSFISCFEDEDDDGGSGLCNPSKIVELSTAYQNAALTYTSNPTYSNCINAKQKATDFYNYIKNCPESGYSADDLLDAINNIDCNP